ncbi:MAG: hypothetical protein K9I68_04690 [Bacteroidales bacterium]|nr:hypothetical protein [Bacteroidales bacterium]
MKSINDILNRVFPNRKLRKEGIMPLYSGTLVRSSEFKKNYHHWKLSDRMEPLLNFLRGHYQQCRRHGEDTFCLGIHSQQGFDGFYIQYNNQIEEHEYSYLLDYFFENAKNLNYRHYHSFEEHKEHNNRLISKESHYLKPVISSFEPPFNQEYGNILLELEKRDQVPKYVKVKVTSYAGFNYHPPREFDELVQQLVA